MGRLYRSPDHESIRPDNQNHRNLESRVVAYLEERGYLVADAPYHSTMPAPITHALKNCYSPTALYLRGRADRVAIHPGRQVVFEWEAKTHQSSQYHNMAIEALPLAHHLAQSELGVECLYVYSDPEIGVDCGFWVHQLPPIREILIPGRWDASMRLWFRKIFERSFDCSLIRDSPMNRGTGDPFVIVDEQDVRNLVSWDSLVDQITCIKPVLMDR